MPAASGSSLCWSLLVLGAFSNLPARCAAVDASGEGFVKDTGLVDSTLALQIWSADQTARSTYYSKLTFVLIGVDYTSLASDSHAVAEMSSVIGGYVCSMLPAPPFMDASDCQVTFSAAASAGKVAVEVAISESSEAAALANTAKFDSYVINMGLDGVVSVAGTVSDHGVATGYELVATSTEHDFGDEATATDDPHLTSVTGKKFDVNMPGSHVLIRVPQDPRMPAKLELNATLHASARAPCGLYIKGLELGGEWLGGQVVGVAPLQRDAEGQNGAGGRTVRAFSVRVGASRAAPGEYEEWGHLGKAGRGLSGRVRLLPAWRQVYADAGQPQEAQAFQFHVRGDGAGHGATLEASQAAHQALDFRASGLKSLGFEQLGGLLGTEGHDRQIEQASDECKAFRAQSERGARNAPPGHSGSSMTAAF